jgi:hypothetical protein
MAKATPKRRSPNAPAKTCAISWRRRFEGKAAACTKISRVHGFAYSVVAAPTSSFFISELANW